MAGRHPGERLVQRCIGTYRRRPWLHHCCRDTDVIWVEAVEAQPATDHAVGVDNDTDRPVRRLERAVTSATGSAGPQVIGARSAAANTRPGGGLPSVGRPAARQSALPAV